MHPLVRQLSYLAIFLAVPCFVAGCSNTLPQSFLEISGLSPATEILSKPRFYFSVSSKGHIYGEIGTLMPGERILISLDSAVEEGETYTLSSFSDILDPSLPAAHGARAVLEGSGSNLTIQFTDVNEASLPIESGTLRVLKLGDKVGDSFAVEFTITLTNGQSFHGVMSTPLIEPKSIPYGASK